MLPVGVIGGRFGKGEERRSLLTYEEQRLMMTLWCMFGSPLMIGGELTMMSGEDLALLTNQDVLDMLRFSGCSKQIRRTAEEAVWVSGSREKGCAYLALFNLDNEERALHIWAGEAAAGGFGSFPGRTLRELWTGEEITPGGSLAVTVPPHGVRVFRYEGG
jgi:hypothetical protein